MSAPRRPWAVWLATGLGIGYGPVMPGTYGSLEGVGLYLALASLLKTLPHPRLLLSITTLAIVAISLKVVAIALRSFQEQDPSEVVLDEVVGQLLTLLPLPLTSPRQVSYGLAIAAGFFLFRALDAVKPYPIWKLERWGGAWGVMADDIGAGGLGAIGLAVLWHVFWKG